MANLFKLSSAELSLFIGKLAKGGFTAEMAEEINRDPSLVGVMVEALKNQLALKECPYPVEYVIDCDADPSFVSEDWKTEEHTKGGFFMWDPTRVELYLDPGQMDGGSIKGDELRKALAGKLVLNASVLDYLLAYPELLPEEWKNRHVYFWGTIYCVANRLLFVRYLYWYGGTWRWHGRSLGDAWCDQCPTVALASI